jgi:enoyl-CoA hydratase
MGALVSYELDGSTATITMDDGKVNALSPAMLTALDAAVDRAAADRAAVLLAGRPGVFSAGFDLGVLGAGGPEAVTMVRAGFELAAKVFAFPGPVVIACTGHAVAMGVFLLQAGDYRIGAAGPYKLTANEVAIGLPVPLMAIELCRQRLAPAHLNRALVLAEPYSPDTAEAAGFLDQVVPAADLAAAAQASAAALAQLSPDAMATTKLRIRGQALAAIRAAIDADVASLTGQAAAAPAS